MNEFDYPCIICLMGLPTRDRGQNYHDSDDLSAASCSSSSSEHKQGELFSEDEFTEVYDGTNDIARVVPCGHQLHNECIKLWIEKANSCPACRTKFNTVEVLHTVASQPVSTYHVDDKVQATEVPDDFDLDDDVEFALTEEPESACLICDSDRCPTEMVLCDSCDAPYHASCLGLDCVPAEAWYCPSCVDNHLVSESIMRAANRRYRAPRVRRVARRARASTRANTRHSSEWNRAWQDVWDRLNNDMCDNQDESGSARSRRARRKRRNISNDPAEEARLDAKEWRVWNLRLKIAESTGGPAFFRTPTGLMFDSQSQEPQETPEMRESWHMLEEALDIQEGPANNSESSGLRLRPSRTFSDWHSKRPESSLSDRTEAEAGEQRKFKRPKSHGRLTDSSPAVPKSDDGQEPPSLMKTLLHDIRQPVVNNRAL
ncbi:hypothetical protein V1512DRAFT_17533 [Lipomyces arxii]|uniref:uncharacterized protein n=1 Tax=Lipomyces arxii TaxID=56418 RepID=UPI0034CE5E0A